MKIYNLVLSIMFMALAILFADQHVRMQKEINQNKIKVTGYCETDDGEVACQLLNSFESVSQYSPVWVYVKTACHGNRDAACQYPIRAEKYHHYLDNHLLNKKKEVGSENL